MSSNGNGETSGTFATDRKVEPVKITVRGRGFNKSFWAYGFSADGAWGKVTEQFNYAETATETTSRRGRPRKTQEERETVAA